MGEKWGEGGQKCGIYILYRFIDIIYIYIY